MSNESNSDSDINSVHDNLDCSCEIIPIRGPGKKVETEQEKPKRKYTKRKQGSEPDRVGHNVTVHDVTGGGGGSTIQQARKKRERNKRCKQELANEPGLIPDGLTDAAPKSRARQPGKDKVRRVYDMESEEDEIDEEENDLDSIIEGMMPFLRPRMNPVDNVLNRITSAFVGCPVMTHLTRTSPSSQKLIIEIDI